MLILVKFDIDGLLKKRDGELLRDRSMSQDLWCLCARTRVFVVVVMCVRVWVGGG
jgi:hypothetical protein